MKKEIARLTLLEEPSGQRGWQVDNPEQEVKAEDYLYLVELISGFLNQNREGIGVSPTELRTLIYARISKEIR